MNGCSNAVADKGLPSSTCTVKKTYVARLIVNRLEDSIVYRSLFVIESLLIFIHLYQQIIFIVLQLLLQQLIVIVLEDPVFLWCGHGWKHGQVFARLAKNLVNEIETVIIDLDICGIWNVVQSDELVTQIIT